MAGARCRCGRSMLHGAPLLGRGGTAGSPRLAPARDGEVLARRRDALDHRLVSRCQLTGPVVARELGDVGHPPRRFIANVSPPLRRIDRRHAVPHVSVAHASCCAALLARTVRRRRSGLRSGFLATLALDRGGDFLGATVAQRADDQLGDVVAAVAAAKPERRRSSSQAPRHMTRVTQPLGSLGTGPRATPFIDPCRLWKEAASYGRTRHRGVTNLCMFASRPDWVRECC